MDPNANIFVPNFIARNIELNTGTKGIQEFIVRIEKNFEETLEQDLQKHQKESGGSYGNLRWSVEFNTKNKSWSGYIFVNRELTIDELKKINDKAYRFIDSPTTAYRLIYGLIPHIPTELAEYYDIKLKSKFYFDFLGFDSKGGPYITYEQIRLHLFNMIDVVTSF